MDIALDTYSYGTYQSAAVWVGGVSGWPWEQGGNLRVSSHDPRCTRDQKIGKKDQPDCPESEAEGKALWKKMGLSRHQKAG